MIPKPITDGTDDTDETDGTVDTGTVDTGTVDTGTVDTCAGFRSTGPAVGEAGAAGVPGDELPGARA